MNNFKTPEEAVKLWCPFARVLAQVSIKNKNTEDHIQVSAAAVNRLNDLNDVPLNSFCVAGACAAWRWASGHTQNRGYCGLAPL